MFYYLRRSRCLTEATGVQLGPPNLLFLQTLGIRQLTFAHRARALQCLLYLADKETIESLFKKPTEEMK